MTRFTAFVVTSLLLAMASKALAEDDKPPTYYQKMADEAKWLPPVDDGGFLHCVAHELQRYQLELSIRPELDTRAISLHILDDGKDVCTLKRHSDDVFFERNNVLYVTGFARSASGCDVEAYDLKDRKQLWKTHLHGIGSVVHSAYLNMVRIDRIDETVFAVYGDETFGRYVEIVDMKTGKTVGHKVFPKTE